MASKKKTLSDEERLVIALESARTALTESGTASGTKLGPGKLRPAVLEALLREGYEKAGAGARVALRRQAEQLVAQGQHIPLTQFGKRLRGAKGTEAKQLVAQLTREGKVRLVLRGKQLTLVPPTERTVEREALRRGIAEVKALHDWLKKAYADKLGTTVLESDLREAHLDLQFALGLGERDGTVRATPFPVPPPGPSLDPAPRESSLADALHGAILALRDEDSALAWIPDISQRLRTQANADQVKDALLAAFQKGEIELRPEGGIGRLSVADAALCPRGPGGLPLSWVRRLEGAEK